MPGQIVLDPRDRTTTGRWIPPGPIPPSLRQFGQFPNTHAWHPGDLLLFSALIPSRMSRAIIRGQERGGYAPEDARWHHAAVYLGDGITICEASIGGVHCVPVYRYVETHLLRIRRDETLSPDKRWLIAMNALTRLGSRYALERIFSLARQARQGYWRRGNTLPLLGMRAVICSELCNDSYSLVTGRLLVAAASGTVKPSDLSMTPQLVDVETSWLRI